ncbi:MAG: PaaI family thioesterase [Acidimicrobiia bacterium]
MPELPTYPREPTDLVPALNEEASGRLPDLLGQEIVELSKGHAVMRCEVGRRHTAPNGYLHAGAVVALADTTAGYGCVASWPDGAIGFTTIEMKANFLRTLLDGVLVATARLVHGGRTTQVWDVEVTAEEDGRPLALLRCTQLILYPSS